MLDDCARRFFKVAHKLPGGIRVNIIVEGHLFAAQLFGRGETNRTIRTQFIQRASLMRILAVPQVRNFVE